MRPPPPPPPPGVAPPGPPRAAIKPPPVKVLALIQRLPPAPAPYCTLGDARPSAVSDPSIRRMPPTFNTTAPPPGPPETPLWSLTPPPLPHWVGATIESYTPPPGCCPYERPPTPPFPPPEPQPPLSCPPAPGPCSAA